MLDNLRSNSEADFIPEDTPEQPPAKPVLSKSRTRRSFDEVTGTTAIQRFLLATMLFMTVCLIGFLLLALTEKIVPIFLY